MGIEEMLLNTQMLREIRIIVNLFGFFCICFDIKFYKESFVNALTLLIY